MTRTSRVHGVSRGPRLGLLVLGGALPTLALVVLLLSGEDGWRRVREVFPAGSGDRALRAGVMFFVLAALAWGVLPVSYHLQRWTRIAGAWFATRPIALRILLSPAEGLNALLAPVSGFLYLIVAAAVVLVFLASLLTFLWIPWPDLLGGYGAFHAFAAERLGQIGS